MVKSVLSNFMSTHKLESYSKLSIALIAMFIFLVASADINAQSDYTSLDPSSETSSEFVSHELAIKLAAQKETYYQTEVKILALTELDLAEYKFYSYVNYYLAQGGTVEEALNNSKNELAQRSTSIDWLSLSDVEELSASVFDYFRI